MKQNIKKIFRSIPFFVFICCFTANTNAQHNTSELPASIKTDGTAPHASAMLDVQSTTKGMLVPRMTTAQRSAISSPATGLMVFDTNTGGFWFYDGTAWADLSAGGAGVWTQATGGIYHNTGNVSVNTTAIDANSNLYVLRPSTDYGADKAGVYAYRNGSSTAANGGTSWSNSGVDAAIKGYSFYGNNYTAGVAGYNYLDYTDCAGVIGANSNASIFGALAYKDSIQTWAGYFTGDTYRGGDLATKWGFSFRHHEPTWGANSDQTWLRKSWSGSFGDMLYLGSTGNRAITEQSALVLSQAGTFIGQASTDASSLSNVYAEFSTDGNEGIRLSPQEADSDISVGEFGLTIRRGITCPPIRSDDNSSDSNCIDDQLRVFPQAYQSGINFYSSLSGWDYMESQFFETGTITFKGVNSGVGDGLLDDGVIRSSYDESGDLALIANDACIVRIGENSSEDGDFVVAHRDYASGTPTQTLLRVNETGNIYAPNLPFGDRSNMQYEASTGRFFYDNSSRRFKENITPLRIDCKKILEATPVSYTRPGNNEHIEIGYIAEDMQDLGLDYLVFTDAEGVPDNFNYEKMILYVVEILKEHENDIANLKAENEKLLVENKVLKAQKDKAIELETRLSQLETMLNKKEEVAGEED